MIPVYLVCLCFRNKLRMDLQPSYLQQDEEEEHSGMGKGAEPFWVQYAGKAWYCVCGGSAVCLR